MKYLKQYQFWVCFSFGLTLFIGTYPFYHDMYIPEAFTWICICLNALSSLLLGKFLYRVWMGRMGAGTGARFILGTILLAVFHAVFSLMNWGSWLFLGLFIVVFVILTVSLFKKKSE